LLKQWRIVNNSDCLVCKEKENYKHFYFDCKYKKKYWQEVKKMTTNLYIWDHVFNLESLVFGYKIYDQAYFDLNLLITLIYFSIYKAYYISNKKKKGDIFKIFKDEVNNVFDTNIFRQVKTWNFISKAHVYLNSWYITWLQNSCNVTWFHMWRGKKSIIWNFITYIVVNSILTCHK
jgi:hypothetical protein